MKRQFAENRFAYYHFKYRICRICQRPESSRCKEPDEARKIEPRIRDPQVLIVFPTSSVKSKKGTRRSPASFAFYFPFLLLSFYCTSTQSPVWISWAVFVITAVAVFSLTFRIIISPTIFRKPDGRSSLAFSVVTTRPRAWSPDFRAA